jgi:hypothetical protein
VTDAERDGERCASHGVGGRSRARHCDVGNARVRFSRS